VPLEVSHGTEWSVIASSTVAAFLGIGLGYLFFGGGYREPARAFDRAFPRLVALVRNKLLVDELYQAALIRPFGALCRHLYQLADRVLIDKVLIGLWAFATDLAGQAVRFVQAGDIQRYLAVFVIGLAALVWTAARPATPDDVHIVVDGHAVTVDVRDAEAINESLTYSFDFDGDGVPDRQGTSHSAMWIYSSPGHYTATVLIQDSRWQTQRAFKRDIDIR
jgi:hypothetical protein